MRAWYRPWVLLGSLVMLVLSFISLQLIMQGPGQLINFLSGQAKLVHYWIAFVSSLLLFILLFSAGVQRKRPKRAIVFETGMGIVRIIDTAVEDLAHRAVKRVKGVKDAKISARVDRDELSFEVNYTVLPDMSIPQINDEIKLRVSEYIEQTIGRRVNEVIPIVHKISAEARARVE
jgi:uncharacterized alkaline shock family protein YloU